ncbi:FmdB family zinc ribbon protein [Wenzhouxiangella marina]|uniref:Regulatory protein, FmdB family n=1 Tax=Wenzhouxiangella marina TaxID=1579979 RepID=A0A0K0XT49_9GAMM|nr:zinc ribbon domain-containing protein [Wenzhouxiangella marina]AKS40889.1 regulatory protein, FmdB family [Wenzhouxiangella marina]MBB6087763.1 putative FmdB family regulatory protein [Wenzhouxiangella marina]
MPIYEYQCKACGHELEKLQKLSDAPLTDCPACHKAELVKKISAAGFRLKGGGWYETDFKKDGKRNLAGDGSASESSSSSKADSSSAGKTDSASSTSKTSGSDKAA